MVFAPSSTSSPDPSSLSLVPESVSLHCKESVTRVSVTRGRLGVGGCPGGPGLSYGLVVSSEDDEVKPGELTEGAEELVVDQFCEFCWMLLVMFDLVALWPAV